MKQCWIKGVALTILVALIAPVFMAGQAVSAANLKEQRLKLVCTSIEDPEITVYLQDGAVMMTIEDIARITRSTMQKSGKICTLRHGAGMRTVVIDPTLKTLSENGEQYDLAVSEYNDTLLVPAYATLAYLGASCSFDTASQSLCIAMPLNTFWEAFGFTLEKRMSPYVKDEEWKKVSIVCDLIIDITAPLSGQSFWEILFLGGADETSAVYEALTVNITKYPAVQANREARQQKLNNVAKALSIAKTFQDAQSDLTAFFESETMQQLYTAIFNFKKPYKTKLFATYQSTMKSKMDFAAASREYETAMTAALFLLDTFTTTIDRLQIDEPTSQALINTFTPETLHVAGDPALDQTYLAAARQVSQAVSTPTDIIAETFMEKASGLMVNQFGSAIEKRVLPSDLRLSIALAGLASELVGRMPVIGKFTPFGEIPKAEADLKAILSADFYQQTWLILSGIVDQAAAEKYHDPATMQRFYDAYMMLLRFGLVHRESLVEYAENSWFKQETANLLKGDAEAIARTIDRLTSCNPDPIPDFSSLASEAAGFDAMLNEKIKALEEEAFIAALPAFPTIDLTKDAIKIVAVLPATFPEYGKDTTFRVIIDYSLQSTENGVVYLGFNKRELSQYNLLEEQEVLKGSGRITLQATVQPVLYDSSQDYLWAFWNSSTTDFKAYVNLSANPHPDSWTPLAEDFANLLPEVQ
ncbi:MAG TPA: hypothetical protein DD640_01515 [Clostridiales bacterium]|nr:hypothetical protein [Clostridiales bacterium]